MDHIKGLGEGEGLLRENFYAYCIRPVHDLLKLSKTLRKLQDLPFFLFVRKEISKYNTSQHSNPHISTPDLTKLYS